MAAPELTKVEQAVLHILANHCGDEVSGRDLRGLLRGRGFRRSAPAFVFTMMNLEDKGVVECQEEVRTIGHIEFKERYYRLRQNR